MYACIRACINNRRFGPLKLLGRANNHSPFQPSNLYQMFALLLDSISSSQGGLVVLNALMEDVHDSC